MRLLIVVGITVLAVYGLGYMSEARIITSGYNKTPWYGYILYFLIWAILIIFVLAFGCDNSYQFPVH